MGYDDTPCRVSADLRRYQRDQDRAAAEYADGLEARKFEAREALEDDAQLVQVLDDAPLAPPLARMFRNIDRAIAGEEHGRDAVFQSALQLRQQCYDWLMDRSA